MRSSLDDTTRSLNGALATSLTKHGKKAGEASPRINFAKQAQIDFMNSKYLGKAGQALFPENQSSFFMTQDSIM
jgi:hypothetical protein